MKNVLNYIRENYVPNKDNISFNSKVPSDELRNNINKNRDIIQDNNEFIHQNNNIKKINNNFINDTLIDKEKKETNLN